MTTKRINSLLIFIFSAIIPIIVLYLFPVSCGYGLCLFFYYPLIFIVAGLSAWVYLKFSEKIQINRTLQAFIVVIINLTLLTYFYPKGEFLPLRQIKIATKVSQDYKKLKQADLFDAVESRNFLLVTALYHKFNLPEEMYAVSYCLIDSLGRCNETFKEFKYFIKNNKLISNDSTVLYELDVKEGTLFFIDTINQTPISLNVGYPNFGKFESDFSNISANLIDSGRKIIGLGKDIGVIRVSINEDNPKVEYGFSKLFKSYLAWTKE